jgi:hypothetical protein
VINAACFKKDFPFTSVDFNEEGVYLNDPEILLGNIPIYVNVIYGEKGSPLVFAKGIDLLADKYP